MQRFGLTLLLFLQYALTSFVCGQSNGPFALYTKSDIPEWNNRPLFTAQRNPYWAVQEQVSSPDVITRGNFFQNFTDLADQSTGYISWGAQDPYPAIFAALNIIEVNTELVPFYFRRWDYPLSDYSSKFSFTTNGQLLFDGVSKFYAKNLGYPWYYGAPVVFWGFGKPKAGSGAGKVTIWKKELN